MEHEEPDPFTPATDLVASLAQGSSAARLIGIVNQAGPQDWRTVAWILERRFRQDFGRNVMEVTREDGGAGQLEVATMQRVILKALPDRPAAKLAVEEALVEMNDHARTA